ncbi:MAG: YchF/TatD family DNA exonuclease [Firmicutes bacterium]|nr:YchF/TatD family DNA exonuclease [Bacillota bacterium]
MFVDSHCHLDKIKQVQQHGLDSVLRHAKAERVEHMLCVGVTLDDFYPMAKLVEDADNVSMSCGLHPLYVVENRIDFEELRQICSRPDVVAVGETGLDYFYDKDHHTRQQQSFEYHIELANSLQKPLIIHTRDAREDTIAMLKAGQAQQCGGVLHCFTENQWMAEQALDLGFYISISGIVTFNSADELREVVRQVPLERLLIETDSPWLAPVPHRGKENQPAYVKDVAAFVAKLKGVSIEEVAQVTRDNFYRLFALAKRPKITE